MEHPNAIQKENQENFLNGLPENERENHARLFRLGNAAYRYHNEAKSKEPTELDFSEWLEGLPSNIANEMKNKGFETCKRVLSFSRYVMEKNDVGMDVWMKGNLNAEDYEFYINQSQ